VPPAPPPCPFAVSQASRRTSRCRFFRTRRAHPGTRKEKAAVQAKAKPMITTIVVVAAIVTIAIGVASGIRWIYRHGQEAGEAKAEHQANLRVQAEAQAKIQAMEARLAENQAETQAKIHTMEAKVAEIQAEMDRTRPRRPRVLLVERFDLADSI
jgi:uncharacterized protein HemX